jgi:hypothetical protein
LFPPPESLPDNNTAKSSKESAAEPTSTEPYFLGSCHYRSTCYALPHVHETCTYILPFFPVHTIPKRQSCLWLSRVRAVPPAYTYSSSSNIFLES